MTHQKLPHKKLAKRKIAVIKKLLAQESSKILYNRTYPINIYDALKLTQEVVNNKHVFCEHKIQLILRFHDIKIENPFSYHLRRKQDLGFLENKNCVFCGKPYDHVHHIIWVKNGGDEDYINIIPTCKKHHKRLHDFWDKKRLKEIELKKKRKEESIIEYIANEEQPWLQEAWDNFD